MFDIDVLSHQTPVQAAEPSWPPATPFHIHPDMKKTLDADGNIDAITFPNRYSMTAQGRYNSDGSVVTESEGAVGEFPILNHDDGMQFQDGKYLRLDLTDEMTYVAMAFIGVVTTAPYVKEDYRQYSTPFSLQKSGTNSTSTYMKYGRLQADFGDVTIYHNHALDYDTRLVMGVCLETRPEFQDAENNQTGLYSSKCKLLHRDGSPISCDRFVSGYLSKDKLHEGFLFIQPQGSTEPLFPEGVTMEWMREKLEEKWDI